jgi:hypothetical protein
MKILMGAVAVGLIGSTAMATTYGTITGRFLGTGPQGLTGVSVTSHNGFAGQMEHRFLTDGTGTAAILNGKQLSLFCLEFQGVNTSFQTFVLEDLEDAPRPNNPVNYGTVIANKVRAVMHAAIVDLGWMDRGFNMTATGTLADEQAAAIQTMVWEAVRDFAGSTLDVSMNAFKFNSGSAGLVSALATLQAVAEANRVSGTYLRNVYALTSETGQDQVIVIPLPTGGAMALAGLLGLATFRRR